MLLAGFDAGQTGTRCRISHWDSGRWQVLSMGEGPGVCHLDAADGDERFREAIRVSYRKAIAAVAAESSPLAAAAIGASGIEQGTALQQRGSALLSSTLRLPDARVSATGDERTALRGAFPDRAGIVLISGTGMIGVGRDAAGREHRCGGWGWFLDGAGSAFDLGHQGLQLSLRMADGRRTDHPLRQQLWDRLGCTSSAEIKTLVVRPEFGSSQVAALAPLVVAAAEKGLPDAERILDQSAGALAEVVKAIAEELCLNKPHIAGCGGGLVHLPRFRSAVQQAVIRSCPGAEWREACGDACDGALQIALDRALRRH